MTAQTKNGSATSAKIAALEEKVELLDWYRAEQAEQIKKLAMAMAGLLAQAMQPQMQQGIVGQLLGNAPPQ
jgi:hypothetical protein